MQPAKNCFWSPTGEYVCFDPEHPCKPRPKEPTCWNYTYQPDVVDGYGNHNQNAHRLPYGNAFWQDSCTKKIYQPTQCFPRFPDCISTPCLNFPHTLIYAPRSANFL